MSTRCKQEIINENVSTCPRQFITREAQLKLNQKYLIVVTQDREIESYKEIAQLYY